MDSTNLRARKDLSDRAAKQYRHLERLVEELIRKDAFPRMTSLIEEEIGPLNGLSQSISERKLLISLAKTKNNLISKVAKEMKLVPKNYYQNHWLGVGMGAFGVPLGILLAFVLDNMALFATGLPVGMALGMAYGTHLDKKARENHRQLDIDIHA